jgi:hypothetical protein
VTVDTIGIELTVAQIPATRTCSMPIRVPSLRRFTRLSRHLQDETNSLAFTNTVSFSSILVDVSSNFASHRGSPRPSRPNPRPTPRPQNVPALCNCTEHIGKQGFASTRLVTLYVTNSAVPDKYVHSAITD